MDATARRRYTVANQAAWDEAAPIHARSNHARLLASFASPGYSTLAEHCLKPLSDIGLAGKSVVQLGCNNGRELVSIKNLGAGRCLGIDGSSAFIEQARELARIAGHDDIELLACDLYDLPDRYDRSFDLVVTTIGVLGWMPDLAGFFRVVTRLLKPCGHFFMEEMHPVLLMYERDKAGGPSYLAYSYFRTEPWRDTDGLDYYTGVTYPSKPNYSFLHPLSAILMTAIRCGLALRHFEELPYDISSFCADLEQAAAKPPLGMTLAWQKTAVPQTSPSQ